MKKINCSYSLVVLACAAASLPLVVTHQLSLDNAYAETTPADSRSIGEKVEDVSDSALLASQKAFFEAVEKKSLSFKYSQGSSKLSNGEKRSVRALVGAQESTRETAYIAAWSDRKVEDSFTSSDRMSAEALAKARMNALEASLKDAGFSGRTVLLNMATRPSLLAKDLGIESEEVKSAAREPSEETTVRHQKIADTLQSNGGPRKAVVVLVPDN
jgi:hypothetical protein